MTKAGDLHGKIVLVAGATRGAGRGTAIELGARGATVYCTGRSTRARARSSESDSPFDLGRRPETIEETAELVSAVGGDGRAMVVDHTRRDEIAQLATAIRSKEGRLDVLVNDVWGGDALVDWEKPFWEQDLEKAQRLVGRAIGSHILTSQAMIPLLFESDQALLIEVTDGDSLAYRGSFFYDLVKTTVIRMAFALSEELSPRGVTALSVTPGFLRSEAMLEYFGVEEYNWREGAEKDENFLYSESPRFLGRGLAALAADPDARRFAGHAVSSWDLAKIYDFNDVDGTRPDWGSHAASASFGAEQRASHRRFVAATAVPDDG